MDSKVWWKSKQIWVAVIALVATALQAKYGFILSPETQGYILTIIMIILRIVTTEPVTLREDKP